VAVGNNNSTCHKWMDCTKVIKCTSSIESGLKCRPLQQENFDLNSTPIAPISILR
jgi:hypothetical protein